MQTAASDVRSLSKAEQLVNAAPPTLPSLPPAAPCPWLGQVIHTPAIILFATDTFMHHRYGEEVLPLAATCPVHVLDVYSCLESIF